MSEPNPENEPLLRAGQIDESPSVYPVIHMIKTVNLASLEKSAIIFITYPPDTPLTYEALTAPDLTYTLVRPLTEKYVVLQQDGNLSIVFCLLINRVRFLRDDNISTHSISRSRAELCEVLATRIFREMANNTLHLAVALTTSWPVFAGADPDIIAQAREDRDDDLEERVGNAIEMAILGKAKRFIKSSACQKIIDGIWSGKCVYQAQSSHSILADTYKRTPIHFYDPHKAPLLDHYRLKVPSIRSVLEFLNFLILFILFIIAIEFSERDTINVAEMVFMIYALGFTLEKVAAMQEHGIEVYFKGTWNGFDLAFITTYFLYAFLRIYGVYHGSHAARSLGTDVLALIACLMFPRLAFVTFKDNLMVLSLRAMIMQFMSLMVIAAFCFCGFLYALWTLSRDEAGLISWWMLDLWFGLDAAGFDNAANFHPIFGPILVVTYACLSNTLLLTGMFYNILSNTFASVNEDAAAEAMFRKAVSTIEGVKADFLFSYQPPVNLIALLILLPSSYVLSPRWFHKLNVFLIRLTSFPVLLSISLYERQLKRAGTVNFYDTVIHVAEKVFDTLPRSLKRMTLFEGLAGAEADIHAVFDIEQEYDSALDMGENDGFSVQQQQQQQRRFSNSSSRRGRPFAPASPPKALPPRMRLQSVVNRMPDAQYVSPLAQIYNPLFVEEETASDSASGPAGISFGPATRRRLTSTAYQRRQTPEQPSQIRAVEMKKFPSLGENIHSPPMQDSRRSRSQEHRKPILHTAAEIKALETEDSASGNLPIGLLERLESLEKRQERIESLLQQISSSLGSNSSP
ncbi:hypothetical protein CPB83DRAFT_850884 [Crepidotus variabilis]|uniref:Calcium channel YVC1 n=1 Tax=Crepidotus variabilis TaxID=179855 RepID=A0A9P6JS46_9AGAR|nr:hypothetical protein CPB83DRAFT_850884 [Crepidotus variabilis]